MAERCRAEVPSGSEAPTDRPPKSAYSIRRKGSVYNIFGPQGRVFKTYKSARIVGPRWEELTQTPWPYRSSAYEPGLRLWQLGLASRDQVGRRASQAPPTPAPSGASRAAASTPLNPQSDATPRPGVFAIPLVTVLALPAPRIDLAEQARHMQALRRDPALLFRATTRTALQREVEYHLPQARWAAHLLKLLERYERRRRASRAPQISSAAITAKHIAWQEARATAPA